MNTKFSTIPILIVLAGLAVTGCTSVRSTQPADAPTEIRAPITPPLPSLTPTLRPLLPPFLPGASSYELSQVNFVARRTSFDQELDITAVAYADFNKDGYMEIFIPSSLNTYEPVPVTIYTVNIIGVWKKVTAEIIPGEIPTTVGPRKSIVADFNGDGYPDVYVSNSGYDSYPWPGEKNILLLSDGNGHLVYDKEHQEKVELLGFHHGASAADIDQDGDIDIFVTNDHRWRMYFLINDGQGHFTLQTNLVPYQMTGVNIFTVELIDVDGDGYVDLVAGGHENWDDSSPLGNQVYWGDGSGDFSQAAHTVLPAVEGYGIVIDIEAEDLNGDGLKDLVLDRTGSPPTNYEGSYIQILIQGPARTFMDETAARINAQKVKGGGGIIWLRAVDVEDDGDIDLMVDLPYDWWEEATWINNGKGFFKIIDGALSNK